MAQRVPGAYRPLRAPRLISKPLSLRKDLPVADADMANALGMSQTELNRMKRTSTRFGLIPSDRMYRVPLRISDRGLGEKEAGSRVVVRTSDRPRRHGPSERFI